MSIKDNIKYIDIESTTELLPYFDGIAALFLECFGKRLDRKLWEWAYIYNPSGSPLVSLAISDEKIVGHYAVIPMPIQNLNQNILGYLSMTTMVSLAFRRYKLFQTLADRVFERIESTKLPSAIFGFPNDNSAPGFRKRLGWTISEEYKIVELTKETQSKCRALLDEVDFDSFFTLNLQDDTLRAWRINKPSQEWNICGGVGIKNFSGGSDLMYLEHPSLISDITIQDKINVILPIGDSEEFKTMPVVFSYRFGYRLFNCCNEIDSPKFFVQMCMSDVF